MTFLPMFLFLLMTFLSTLKKKKGKQWQKEKENQKKKKKPILTTNQGIEKGIILLPNLQQGEWWRPTANCNHIWNCFGRKEGRIWERRSGKVGRRRRTEGEEKRGAQESRKTAAANGGDGRTDDSCWFRWLVGISSILTSQPCYCCCCSWTPLLFFTAARVGKKTFTSV